jgi:hypothetical protein
MWSPTSLRETCAHLSDEMMLTAGLQTAPDGSNAKLVAVRLAERFELRSERPLSARLPDSFI